MGIDAHALTLLRYAHGKYGDFDNTITFGRLAIHLGPKAMQRWTGSRAGTYCEDMLTTHFGATHVDSIDNSGYEGATIIADMNQPLPDRLKQQYDSVIDFGTTEHIFDVAQSFRNITALCKPGARLLHVVPANGLCGHGFYQFSPEFFFSRYSQTNGCADIEVFLADLLDARHWYSVPSPRDGKRINVRTTDQMYVIVMAKWMGAGGDKTQQSDYEFAWSNAGRVVAAPYGPGRIAWLRERFSCSRLITRWISRADACLATNGVRSLQRHPALIRIPVDSLLQGE